MTDIAPFSLPGRFWRGNIHTHSTLSDGVLSPEKVVEAYQRAGYDFLQLSEHFVSIYNWPIADTRQFRTNSFTTLIGAELHAPKTTAGELWHILAAGLPLDFEPCGENESGVDISRRAADSGAFISIAHPAWSQLTIEDGLAMDMAHSVEIYNTGCDKECDRGDGTYLLDQLLNKGKRLSANATDDAHFANGDHDAFGGWVHVKAPSLDPEEILKSLKAGQFYSSQGPQIHEVSISDNQVHVVCSPVSSIAIVCHHSRTATSIGHAITSASLNLADLEKSWVAIEPSPWIRLVIKDHAGKRAWTNPIWLDEL